MYSIWVDCLNAICTYCLLCGRMCVRVRALERTHTGTRSWYARSRCLCPSVYTSVRMMGANAPYFIHDVQSFEYKSDNIIDVG